MDDRPYDPQRLACRIRELYERGVSLRELAEAASLKHSYLQRAMANPGAVSLSVAQRIWAACDTVARESAESDG